MILLVAVLQLPTSFIAVHSRSVCHVATVKPYVVWLLLPNSAEQAYAYCNSFTFGGGYPWTENLRQWRIWNNSCTARRGGALFHSSPRSR